MRKELWPDVLAEFITDMENEPFSYGTHDCMMFAANCVKAILTNDAEDPATEFRDSYSTELGAGKILQKAGGMEAMMDARFEPVPPLCIRRGDFVLTETKAGPTLGVSVGPKFVVAQDPRGVRLYDIRHALKGWRVD